MRLSDAVALGTIEWIRFTRQNEGGHRR